MQLQQIKPIHKLKKRKRIGRGGKKGTYCGRGTKGQKARAGRRFKPAIRELIKKYPKLRGYRRKLKAQISRLKTAILNVELLEKKFKSGDTVNPEILFEKRIIRKIKRRMPEVKILGKGELTKSLIIEGCQVSKSVKEKIAKAGGTIK